MDAKEISLNLDLITIVFTLHQARILLSWDRYLVRAARESWLLCDSFVGILGNFQAVEFVGSLTTDSSYQYGYAVFSYEGHKIKNDRKQVFFLNLQVPPIVMLPIEIKLRYIHISMLIARIWKITVVKPGCDVQQLRNWKK